MARCGVRRCRNRNVDSLAEKYPDAADDLRIPNRSGRLTAIAFGRTLMSPWQMQNAQVD
jgi:hypothetical protein